MNKTKSFEPHPFIRYLQSKAEDRGFLAALRRGAGKPPGTVPTMYPHIVRWIKDDFSQWREATYYLIASLFALHPNPKSTTQKNLNLGHHFAQTNPTGENKATERRFTILLNTHPEDLHRYLQHAISFLKSKEVSINWNQLFWDVQKWNNPDRRVDVQKKWAKGYWGAIDDNKTKNKSSKGV